MGIDYEALGKRIAKRRKVLNLTQEDVAEAAGLSNNFISNIENNYSIPSIDSLLRICEAIDTTPNYLLLGSVSYSDAEEDLRNKISERLRLCSQKKLRMIERFVTWIIDEDI
jgi:transcriptional regulator with XRE-family HTH domain